MNMSIAMNSTSNARGRRAAARTLISLGAFAVAAAGTAALASTPSTPSAPSIQTGPLTLTFGGFAELGTVYRNRNQSADIGSDFKTPRRGPHNARLESTASEGVSA